MHRKSGKSILLLVTSLTAVSCSSQKAPPDQPLTDCEVTMSSELGLTAVDATLICGFVDEKNAQSEPLRALADWVNQPRIHKVILFLERPFHNSSPKWARKSLQRLGYFICNKNSAQQTWA